MLEDGTTEGAPIVAVAPLPPNARSARALPYIMASSLGSILLILSRIPSLVRPLKVSLIISLPLRLL